MKYSDVKWYLKHGQDVAKLFDGVQPYGETVGYYHPSTANWSYQQKIVMFNDKLYDVLTQFGVVVGGRQLHLMDNKDKAGL